LITKKYFLSVFLTIISSIQLYGQDQRIADSLRILNKELELKDSINLEVLLGIAHNENDLEVAMEYADYLVGQSKQFGNNEYLWAGYSEKGNIFLMKGDYSQALKLYFDALNIAEVAELEKKIGASYITIADTYSESGNSELSTRYYKEGLKVLREANDSVNIATALFNAGDEYYKRDQLDTALSFFEESARIFELLDSDIGQAYNLGNVGLVFAKLGRNDSSEIALNKATKILEEMENFYPITYYNYSLSNIYRDRGDLSKAIAYANSGYLISENGGLNEQLKEGALKLSNLYELKGDPSSAFYFLKVYNAYEDSTSSNTAIQEMAELQRKYELAKKQLEVDILNREKYQQQVIGIALTIVLAMVFVVLVVLYRNNQRKQKLNKELEMINETKDRFFSIISHDLRGPISAFYGISRMIRMFIGKQQYGRLEEMTEQIDHSVSSISSLLDNLLSWAVQKQGQFPYHPEHIQLHKLTENLKYLFQNQAESKNIEINFKIQPSLFLFVDKNSAMTIFRNLISNALKFTPEGGAVNVYALYEDDFIAIRFTDTGLGMNKEKVDSLFKSQVQSTYGTSGEKGVGLGLQLVFDFVQLNHGNIKVESEENVGTTFTVRLPRGEKFDQNLEEESVAVKK